jgi:hypothetical protein
MIVGEQIERLVRFVCQTSWDDVLKRCGAMLLVLLDTLGVILAGSEQPEVQQLRNRLIASGGQGATALARNFPPPTPDCSPVEWYRRTIDRAL